MMKPRRAGNATKASKVSQGAASAAPSGVVSWREGELVRLNKWLAATGRWSRREAEGLITAGQVMVNGQTVTTLGTKARYGLDKVFVNGERVGTREHQAPVRVVVHHKRKDRVCTRRDERGRPTVFDDLPPRCLDLDCVGRLDRDSTGLLLLTNHGDLLHALTHPSFSHEKEYRVTVRRAAADPQGRGVPFKTLPVALEEGVYFEEERQVVRARVVGVEAPDVLVLVLTTGLNRQIRRMLALLGWDVTRLKRTRMATVALGDLRPGAYRELSSLEVKKLFQMVSKTR
jgi:pseudouridine synthase